MTFLRRHTQLWFHACLALVAYVPLLLTAPGRVSADTKTYLYLDPAKLLSRAWSMWDPNIGLGTVSHQTIGYLFPMGPYYWLLERLGVPDWVAQRLWLATVLFLAGAGVLFLLRTIGAAAHPAASGGGDGTRTPARTEAGARWGVGAGALVAALAYLLSPYVLDYAARISVILLPWAGLPWMVGLVIRALRRGGWRDAALFALVVQLVGGVNATALVYAGLGPVLWVPYAVFVLREVRLRAALAAVARIGVLTVAASLWWITGLAVQGAYGVDILRYTETIPTVAKTSLASEVLRGLGYWFFYGRDKVGPWIRPAVDYTQRLWVLAASFLVPVLAFAAAALVRWRERAYFAALVLVGTVIAVGTYPYDHPSPAGALFKAAAQGSTAGLALRSTARAVPLVALGLSVLLGAGIAALVRRDRRTGLAAAFVAAVVVVAAQPSLFQGHLVDPNLDRPQTLPSYWYDAARFLDSEGDATRVLEVPGSDFAAYRWGNTVDPVLPGIMDRPYVARELIPYGGDATADLLNAFDRRIQEGVFEPRSAAPVARLMGVGDIVLRNDLQFERYNTPRPQRLWSWFRAAPGLGEPRGFGAPVANRGTLYPMQDEIALAIPPDAPHPPPVAAFPVEDAVPIVRAEPARGALVVAGDGEGIVDAAAAGVLDGRGPVLYSASDPPASALDGADLVLTDTNRRRARRWSTVRETTGYTELAGEEPLVADPGDARLAVFPGAGDDAYSVVELDGGVAQVQASHYGNPVSYTPEDRARNALDGDPLTAWRVGAFGPVVGERLVVTLQQPVTADHVTITQPITGPRNRYVTRATLVFDGDESSALDVALGDASRQRGGQRVSFPRRTFRTLEYRIAADNVGPRASYRGQSAVGVAELAIPGVRAHETVRLPTDLLTRLGPASTGHRLTILLTRLRAAPVPPRTDEEVSLSRVFELPAARSFALAGVARLSAMVPDELLDALLGRTEVVARSSGRLPGLLAGRASSAIDGDPSTAWTAPFGPQEGHWLAFTTRTPVRYDALRLTVRADGRHSVPTRLRVEAPGVPPQEVDVPPVADRPGEDANATVTVPLRGFTASQVKLTIVGVRNVVTTDYYAEAPITMPVGIADLGVPGLSMARPSGAFPPACRRDLVRVDGAPYPVRLVGDRLDAERLGDIRLEPCGGALRLAAGRHRVDTAVGRDMGVDVDRLVLSSAPGGGAAPAGRAGRQPAPRVRVESSSRTSMRLRVEPAAAPFWLVLGQSRNTGWTAHVSGRGDLGESRLVDGYANGWLLPATSRPLEVTLTWTPQRGVDAALVASLLAALACLALALWPRRRAAGPAARVAPAPAAAPELGAEPPAGGGRVAAAGVAVAAGVVLGVVTLPVLGVAAGVAAGTALRWPRARWVLRWGAVACVAAAGAYTVVQQARYGYPPEFEWPTFFHRAHVAALAGVALLGADAAVDAVRYRRRARQPEVFSNTSA